MADTPGQADTRKGKAEGSMAEEPQEDWKIREKGGRFSQ